MDVATVHVEKNQGLAFHRTGDRPEAALSDRHEVRVNKNIRVGRAYFPPGWRMNTLNFPWTSIKKYKKSKNKGSLRQRADPLKSSPPTLSVCVPIGQVFCMIHIKSRFNKFSDWPSLPGRAKAGGEEEKEWASALEHDSAVILAPYHEKLRVQREWPMCFQRAIYRCGEPFFLSFNIRASSILWHWHRDLLQVGV